MYNIKDAIGWIGNVAVFKSENGYVLIDWPFSYRKLEVEG